MRTFTRRTLLRSVSATAGGSLTGAAQKRRSARKAKLGIRSHLLEKIKRERIRITDVRVTLLSAEIPKERQWYNPRTIVWKSDAVLVQVFTDQGVVGIGEGTPYGGPVEMKQFAEDFVKPALVGQNPFDVELLAGGWAPTPQMPGSRVWAGMTESWHIARMAHLRKKYCCPHDWHGGLTIMANAALVAGIPNRLLLEHNVTFSHLREGVFKEPLVARRGYMDLPDKPGFGVELAADLPKKFPYLPGRFDRPNPDLPA